MTNQSENLKNRKTEDMSGLEREDRRYEANLEAREREYEKNIEPGTSRRGSF